MFKIVLFVIDSLILNAILIVLQHSGKSFGFSTIDYQRFDGWFNNLAFHDWGSVDNHLTRICPASYSDGVYMLAGRNRPSARKLSQMFMSGSDGLASLNNRTALLAFFGQVVTSEIVMASEGGCPIERHRIDIERCDQIYDPDCKGDRYMPFYRANFDQKTGRNPNSPREQINKVTSWIDGSFVYSTSEAWVSSMRSYRNGSLQTDKTGQMPVRNTIRAPLFNSVVPHMMKMLSPERFYLLGDPRSNQNPALLVFGILFFRWHNVIAGRLQNDHPNWSDERIFQRTRQFVIASIQNIFAYEFFPAFVGSKLEPYKGYKSYIHPGISHEFQTSAFRFGHSLIPSGMFIRDNQCNFKRTKRGFVAHRLCSTWWDANTILEENSIEDLLMGMASQIAEREDSILCSDLQNKLFGPMEFSRRDLGALNIMRGRDNGLPDFNTVRSYFKLNKISKWNDISPELFKNNPELKLRLIEAYSNKIDDIDLYVGGMLESYGRPGSLFSEIIQEQFMRLRDADRFWFENQDTGIFTNEEIDYIRRIKLWDIIVNSTSIEPDQIQRNVFFFNQNDPCPQPFQLNVSMLESCQYLRNNSYYKDNGKVYMYSCTILFMIPIVCILIGYVTVKFEDKRRQRFKQNSVLKKEISNSVAQKHVEKIPVREWLHANHKRYIKLKLGPSETISVTDRKDNTLRQLNLSHIDAVLIEESKEMKKPLLIIRIPNDYDLVLEWDTVVARKKFVSKLEIFLNNLNKNLIFYQNFREIMLMRAETYEKRQNRLDHFFREAYALTFGLKDKEKRKNGFKYEDEILTVMKTSLSKTEFANALGMKSDAIFVQKMFNIVDKDRDGRISFQEFLDTVALFSHGKPDDKLRIIFDMCDNDKNGIIDKTELSAMLRSLIEVAKTNSLLDEQISELIDRMFYENGLAHKDYLTYQDFKVIMKDYKGDFVTIGLDCKGVRQNFFNSSNNFTRLTNFQMDPNAIETEEKSFIGQLNYLITFLEENRQNIFYLFIFYVITIFLFVERFIHYSFMAEHTDLRHIMGVGIAITRGSAASLSFCYSLLLLTMSRNLITKLKEYSIQQYIPFDSHIQFHKIAACTALFFSILHTFGHLVNFFHVSTQSVENLKCLTNEISFASDNKPGVYYWLFQTLTGITGVLLFIVMCIIFIFAHPLIRKRAYNVFWTTHSFYIVMYALCLIHGLAKLTGEPRFWMFIIVPGTVFAFDKIISLRTRIIPLDIIETELLPSDVLKIKFFRPPNFKYLSGQWIKLTCTAFNNRNFHSFTLTSAPHENFLSCHIKSQGPWTWKFRNYFDPTNFQTEVDEPKILLEGPYGGGNQDWYKFEVAVMVGGGIGVTPYASILNDLVFGTSTNRYSGVACKKVYFLWICPSHKHFEWFIDVLRDVERRDVTNVLEVHIFITQFFHKFDLRTTMLYICENHFQRLSKTSLFTGLKAVNHFGRPDMSSFLKFVQKKHSYVSKIGVFSCGPRPLTKSVMSACEEVNVTRKLPYFVHHFENFG